MYFLITKDFALGSKDGFSESSRTQDVTAEELAHDYELQLKLGLATQACIVPLVPWARPTPQDKRLEFLSRYISEFSSDAKKREDVYRYLINNGVIRILWKKDKKL